MSPNSWLPSESVPCSVIVSPPSPPLTLMPERLEIAPKLAKSVPGVLRSSTSTEPSPSRSAMRMLSALASLDTVRTPPTMEAAVEGLMRFSSGSSENLRKGFGLATRPLEARYLRNDLDVFIDTSGCTRRYFEQA